MCNIDADGVAYCTDEGDLCDSFCAGIEECSGEPIEVCLEMCSSDAIPEACIECSSGRTCDELNEGVCDEACNETPPNSCEEFCVTLGECMGEPIDDCIDSCSLNTIPETCIDCGLNSTCDEFNEGICEEACNQATPSLCDDYCMLVEECTGEPVDGCFENCESGMSDECVDCALMAGSCDEFFDGVCDEVCDPQLEEGGGFLSFNISNMCEMGELELMGDASCFMEGEMPVGITLANAEASSEGALFFGADAPVGDAFSTQFSFEIRNPGGVRDDCGGNNGADGFTFVIHEEVLGSAGGGLGVQGIDETVFVEFDTFCNSPNEDPSSNHIGIMIDGNVHHEGQTGANVEGSFEDGETWWAWIDYNGTMIEVFVAHENLKPEIPSLTREVDVAGVTGGSVRRIGFTGATGQAWENVIIKSWSFQGSAGEPSCDETCELQPEGESLFFGISNMCEMGELELMGDASCFMEGEMPVGITLANAEASSEGALFFGADAPVGDAFSTQFSFEIRNPGGVRDDCGGNNGADGFTFVIHEEVLGSAGGGLGVQGIDETVFVEFDTFCNSPNEDPSSNHIGIMIDGNVHHEGQTGANIEGSFEDGETWWAWIGYNGTTIEVFVAGEDVKPEIPSLTREVDVAGVTGGSVRRIGFTGATGQAWENVIIKSWMFEGEAFPR